jgi:peptidoglycan/LPS O-acetylase OafA/YrhL
MTLARPSHRNNFGLLRVAFAMCVLISHSFELVDGNRIREPLTRLFGTLSFGEFGVAGFFIVSGYLIAQSFENSTSIASFIWKRALRIYPGFITASLFCLIVVAPFSGAVMSSLIGIELALAPLRMIVLAQPMLPDAFSGLAYQELDGPMWTIAYEFRCYLTVAIVAGLGLFRFRRALAFAWISLVLATAFIPFETKLRRELIQNIAGTFHHSLQFSALFASGVVFYLFRDRIRFKTSWAVLAAVALCICLFGQITSALAVPTLGGYLIFWFAFLPSTPQLNRINATTDLSYGIYLYAWPIQSLLVKYIDGISPWLVMVLTTLATVPLAFASWKLIERPFLSLKKTRASDPSLSLRRS